MLLTPVQRALLSAMSATEPRTVRRIAELAYGLVGKTEWHRAREMLDRLVIKGAVRVRRVGPYKGRPFTYARVED
jgi:predicted ArsR family transcriptional regulator